MTLNCKYILLVTLLFCLGGVVWNVHAQPSWTAPHPADFEYSANMLASFFVDGQPRNNPNDLLAVFNGSELRGVGLAIPVGEQVFHNMTIYSDVPSGEDLNLVVYLADEDTVFNTVTTYSFVQLSVTGNPDNPFEIVVSTDGDLLIRLDTIPKITRLQGMDIPAILLSSYILQTDQDPIQWSTSSSPNFHTLISQDSLFLTPVNTAWIGSDSIQIFATEDTENAYADTAILRLTIDKSYDGPEFQMIPDRIITPAGKFDSFSLSYFEDTYSGDSLLYSCYPEPSPAHPQEQYSWVQPDLSGLPYTMSVVAQVQYSPYYLFDDADDRLGAFIDGTLRGLGTPQMINGSRLFLFQVSHTAPTAELEFRYFSDSLKKVLYEPDTFAFNNGSTMGNPNTPQALDFSPLFYQIDSLSGHVDVDVRIPGWTGTEKVFFVAQDYHYPAELVDTVETYFTRDSDGDGLGNGTEGKNGFNFMDPCSPPQDTGYTGYVDTNNVWRAGDCDGDGLLNGEEHDSGTDPYNNDSDGDGIDDNSEGTAGTLPLDPCSPLQDTGYTGYVDTNNVWRAEDCDGDGLLNSMEDGLGTDPYNVDSDSDGYEDGDEVEANTDPLDKCDPPAKVSLKAYELCEADSLIFEENGGDAISWFWEGPGDFSDTTQTPFVSPGLPGEYPVVVTVVNGCTLTDTVIVHPLPLVNAVNSGPYCSGEIGHLSEVGGEAIQWMWVFPSGFTSSVHNPKVSPVTEGIYSVTVMDTNNCQSTDYTEICVSVPEVKCLSEFSISIGESGSFILLPEMIDNNSSGSDCAGISALSISQATWTCEDIGIQEVALIVEDTLGCKSSCNTTLVISDSTNGQGSGCACDGEALVLSGPINSADYKATVSIESSGSIQSGDSVLFQAGQKITLFPGFSANSGSLFTAKIADCTSQTSRSSFRDFSTQQKSVGLHDQEPPKPQSRRVKTPGIPLESRVWPNPFTTSFTIEISISSDAIVSARLFSVHGNHTGIEKSPVRLSGGTHQFILQGDALAPGIYFLVISFNGHQHLHRLICIK